MRIRASYTIENSILIPLFTIIVMSFIMLDFYLHDSIVCKSAAVRTAIITELEEEYEECRSRNAADEEKINSVVSRTELYLRSKTIAQSDSKASVYINDDNVLVKCGGKPSALVAKVLKKNKTEASGKINKNLPDEYVRMINALRSVVG